MLRATRMPKLYIEVIHRIILMALNTRLSHMHIDVGHIECQSLIEWERLAVRQAV